MPGFNVAFSITQIKYHSRNPSQTLLPLKNIKSQTLGYRRVTSHKWHMDCTPHRWPFVVCAKGSPAQMDTQALSAGLPHHSPTSRKRRRKLTNYLSTAGLELPLEPLAHYLYYFYMACSLTFPGLAPAWRNRTRDRHFCVFLDWGHWRHQRASDRYVVRDPYRAARSPWTNPGHLILPPHAGECCHLETHKNKE